MYKPVCGCDGKEYGNQCMAEKAGVTKWENGKCGDCKDPNPRKTDCPDDYAPVCGCDGKTYTNACQAGNNGVRRWVEGKCK